MTTQKNGASALGLQRVLGLKSYETAWTWLHKLRRAMVRPGRDLLDGRIEVDEGYVGGPEAGLPGRLNLEKTLVVIAVQEDGKGIGRIRMRQISDASSESLMPFVRIVRVSGFRIYPHAASGSAWRKNATSNSASGPRAYSRILPSRSMNGSPPFGCLGALPLSSLKATDPFAPPSQKPMSRLCSS